MTAVITESLGVTLRQLNLTEGEYRKIVNNLQRAPNFNELAMFSVLWSEHCCYKNSRHLLKKLPTQGPRIVQGPGENAGVVDAGDGIHVAFKIESHNHPTAVEPFQGAATGVGGILRDIFTMNARPIANLNSLRFGPLSVPRNRYLFDQAVKGIGHYGNCVGVPTIGGEVFFDEVYSGNPLVNAMAIGLMYENDLMPSAAQGIGNPILYVGSQTGKDGMGGAAFASRELDANSDQDRPAVQVGDPFAEKLLIEACLEAFRTECVVAAQDMGAAGLTSSSCEMAAKGGVGIVIDLDLVPAREPGMKAFEYLLSESQERMLLVLDQNHYQPVLDVFKKWNLPAVVVGEITEGNRVKILHKGETVVDLPVDLLTDLAPSYDRGNRPTEPEAAKALRTQDAKQGLQDLSPNQFHSQLYSILEKLLAQPNIARPSDVFQQYDRHVQNNTVLGSENQCAGVIQLRKPDGSFSGKAIAATTDCNPRYVYLEPYNGAMSAVAEAARNLACVGATPLAVTDNLNFGNPEKPEIYYQLYYAIEGIKDACLAFKTPVTGGNVSLYNEYLGTAIYPTPVIGMVGLVEELSKVMSPAFKNCGDRLALVGRFKPSLGGSEYQKIMVQDTYGPPPDISLNDEAKLQQGVLSLIQQGLVQSVQDLSLGGLLVSVLECGFLSAPELRNCLKIDLDFEPLRKAFSTLRFDELCFGETQGTCLISYNDKAEMKIKGLCETTGIAFFPLGELGTSSEGFKLKISNLSPSGSNASEVTFPMDPLLTLWCGGLDA
ncbi:MAG: phosphoribosylformylglycinamidine synthase subunit PurL [Cyanobacteria bacterium]|nr:phosphoribosylformylglycinamidine synthase subunit PurL [Cyanobacteriota bacterium]